MANPMLAELDAVVRLMEAATPGAWMSHTTNITQVGIDLTDPLNAHGLAVASGHPEEAKANAAAIAAAVNFLRTHHATLADMAKDAARYRWLRVRLAGAEHVNELEEYNQTMHSGLASDVDQAIDATQEGEG